MKSLQKASLKNICSQILICFGILLVSACQEPTQQFQEPLLDTKDTDKRKNIPSYRPVNEELYDTIMKLDKKFWKAWNEGDLQVIEDFTSEDHEFYHDRGGVVKTKEENMKLWRSFFENRPQERGTGYKDGNEVYEIPGFGALHVGYQQFFNDKNPDGTPPSRVITLWKETAKGWKQEYVFSTHAHPAEKFDSIQVIDLQQNRKMPMKEGFKYEFISDYMQATAVDTSGLNPNYQLLVHYPGNVTDTILSTGTLFKHQNGARWMKADRDLVSKYSQ